ncbi:MAG: hypothetical protein Q7R95_06600 [bacterium]|nr:hypothetical protein [bacterium]
MYNFHKGGNRFGGGGRDFKKPEYGRRDFSDRQMHKTTCSKCGKECEVPFVPTGVRPVFCSSCFEHNRESESPRHDINHSYNRRSEPRENSGPSQEQLKKQFESLNWKLDKIIKLLTPETAPKVEFVKKIEEKIAKPVKEIKPIKNIKIAKKKKIVKEIPTV